MQPFPGGYHHPEDLRWGMKVLGILDTILCSRPEVRYHSFVAERFPGVDVGIVNNGAGAGLVCLLSDEHGSLIKGFDHASPLSPHGFVGGRIWPGIYDETPPDLLQYLDDPEFQRDDVTFCLWRPKSDKTWRQGDVEFPTDGDDGSSVLLGAIHLDAASYLSWACDYYGLSIPEESVQQVYESGEIDRATALAIHPQVDLTMLERELAAMEVRLA